MKLNKLNNSAEKPSAHGVSIANINTCSSVVLVAALHFQKFVSSIVMFKEAIKSSYSYCISAVLF